MQAMVIHVDYIIYVFNFIIYVVLCGLLIKQARQDIFATAKEEKERTTGCPVHRIQKAAIARRTSCSNFSYQAWRWIYFYSKRRMTFLKILWDLRLFQILVRYWICVSVVSDILSWVAVSCALSCISLDDKPHKSERSLTSHSKRTLFLLDQYIVLLVIINFSLKEPLHVTMFFPTNGPSPSI